LVLFSACKKDQPIVVTTDDYCAAVDTVTGIMVHDIFSPPVASRIYVYPNIAAYEIIAQNSTKYESLQGQLNGLDSIPVLDAKSGVNQKLAALIAHMEVSKQLIFSEEALEKYRDSLYEKWGSENKKEFEVSKEYALKVVDRIKIWMGKDNYKQTRTFPKYSVHTDQAGRWQPTPPAYMDGVEPHWGEIRTLVMDSASQFKPKAPHPFSTDKNSLFYKEAKETYDVGNLISTKLLAIENRADIQETDTIFYKLGQVRLSTYRFAFTPENIVTNGLGAFLEDSYLNTSTPVSLSAVTDVDFVITHPEDYELSTAYTKGAIILHDQDAALKGADFVYVKNWSTYTDYGKIYSNDPAWMLTKEKLQLTNSAKVMHCLPVRRNVELSDEILDSSNSIVTQQAGNRVWAAQAVLSELLNK
jgi:hypothetical protein